MEVHNDKRGYCICCETDSRILVGDTNVCLDCTLNSECHCTECGGTLPSANRSSGLCAACQEDITAQIINWWPQLGADARDDIYTSICGNCLKLHVDCLCNMPESLTEMEANDAG